MDATQTPGIETDPVNTGAQFSEEEQQSIVKRLKYHYDTYMSDVSPLHKAIDKWKRLYDAKPENEIKNFPWKGAANYVIPLIASVTDAIHARIAKAVFNVDPLWLAKARTPSGVDSSHKAQWYLDYWSDYMNLPHFMDLSILSMLQEGTGILKIEWSRRYSRTPAGEVMDYDAPSVYQVPLKDFVLIPADSPSIDDAVYVGHRVFRNVGQLLERRDSGQYFNVDQLLKRSATGDGLEGAKSLPTILVNRTDNNSSYAETRTYELVELYGDYDYGDGVPVRSVFTFSPQHNILLRLEPYPHQYNRFPYVDFKVLPRPNFFFGRSVPELLESFQDELTAMHNMRSDAITKRIAPPITRMRGSLWDPKEQYWAPGQVIDINEPGEIAELALSEIPMSSFAQETDLMAFVERLTGMSDYNMGRSSGSTRTATEVNRVVSEGLARLDIQISRFQYGMTRLAWHIFWLLYQYRPVFDAFHADGEDMVITKAEMRPDVTGMMPYEFQPQGVISDASKENLRQQDLLLLQIAAPFLQQFNPDGLQYLLDDILRLFDKQDRARILGSSWSQNQAMLQQAFSQGFQEGIKQGGDGGGQ